MTFTAALKLLPWIVILLLLIVVLWFWRDKDNAQSNLIAAQSKVAVVQGKLDTDDATIVRLTTYNTANDKIMARFVSEMSGVDAAFGKLNTDISNLRRTNADVEKYLAQPIPQPLLCLLDTGNSVCGKTVTATPSGH